MIFDNRSDLPLSIAVFLAQDTYVQDPNSISVTKLIKPVRELILAERVPPSQQMSTDILQMYKSRLGSAIHLGIENSWHSSKLVETLMSLGINQSSAKKFVVNPEPQEVNDAMYPVYTEKTFKKMFDGYQLKGTADFIIAGNLTDFKTTSTYSYIDPARTEKYKLQGSIYRWLNPEVITDDTLTIVEMYLDWSPSGYLQKPDSYPPEAVIAKRIPMLSLADTERYVAKKISTLEKLMDAPQEELPLCTDEELWRKPSVYKYYATPDAARSSKNFNDPLEASAHLREKGKGEIREVKGTVGACRFCPALPVCEQAKEYINQGILKV